jgi:hypothetical protein
MANHDGSPLATPCPSSRPPHPLNPFPQPQAPFEPYLVNPGPVWQLPSPVGLRKACAHQPLAICCCCCCRQPGSHLPPAAREAAQVDAAEGEPSWNQVDVRVHNSRHHERALQVDHTAAAAAAAKADNLPRVEVHRHAGRPGPLVGVQAGTGCMGCQRMQWKRWRRAVQDTQKPLSCPDSAPTHLIVGCPDGCVGKRDSASWPRLLGARRRAAAAGATNGRVAGWHHALIALCRHDDTPRGTGGGGVRTGSSNSCP